MKLQLRKDLIKPLIRMVFINVKIKMFNVFGGAGCLAV